MIEQIELLAPKIHGLLNSKHARVTASVTSHDVTKGYGRGFTYNVKFEILIEQCLNCFETPYTEPSFDCRWHRFESRYMQIADAEASTLEKAIMKLEAAMVIRDERIIESRQPAPPPQPATGG